MAAEYVKSVAKAAAILGAFDSANRLLTVREIAELTGIPRSTVQDICKTLVESKLLERGSRGGLQLGVGLAMLGGQVIERTGVVEAAQAPIRRHLDKFGLEVHVGIHYPGAVFYAYLKAASGHVGSMNRTGRRWLVTDSGCGRAILAASSPTAREQEYPPLFGDEARVRLEREIAAYERNGYLVSNVAERGLVSITAPIFDVTSLPIGALGVGDAVSAMTRRRVAELGEAVRAAAKESSAALGYTRH